MSIAEKLTTIAENQQKVYEAGKEAEYNAFWDAFQDNGSRTGYIYGFAGRGWTDGNFKPKYSIIAASNCNHMFNSNAAEIDLASYLESKAITLDASGVTSFSEAFRYSRFTRLPALDLSKVTSLYLSFGNCEHLHTIDEIKVSASCTFSNTFMNDTELKEIRFGEGSIIGNSIDFHYSTALSFGSVESIFGCLGGSASATLTLPASHNDGRYASLIASKPSNWAVAWL